MEKKNVFTEDFGESGADSRTALEFFLLYRQSVLLALCEQGILSESQLRQCLERLK